MSTLNETTVKTTRATKSPAVKKKATTTKAKAVNMEEPKVEAVVTHREAKKDYSLAWFEKHEVRMKANSQKIKLLRDENTSIMKELFGYFVDNYVTLENDIKVVKHEASSKDKKAIKEEVFKMLVDKVEKDYTVKTDKVRNLIKAFEAYKASKCYLDLTINEFMSDNETKNLSYINPSQFIKFFTYKDKDGKLFANSIKDNKAFFDKLAELNKLLAIEYAQNILNASK